MHSRKGLPKLESLSIGQVAKESFDFQRASLVVEGGSQEGG